LAVFTTRDRILLSLGEKPGTLCSGASLARQLGITRASIWKHVKALQREGFPIRSSGAQGYTLAETFDLSLLRGDVWKSLKFWKPHYQISTTSTQRQAREAAEQSAPEGHFWIAEKQLSGRGRLDRKWESGFGGLWFSILLRPAVPPAAIPALPLVAALTLAKVLERQYELNARLKWPNDVIVQTTSGWKKMAGILTEMSAEIDRTRWVVIGIGLNVNNILPRELRKQATAVIDLTQRPANRAALLKAFLNSFAKTYRQFEKMGFKHFKADYWHRYGRPNTEVQLRTSRGVVWGSPCGVDDNGALVVESKGSTQSIWEGEIVL
jgi:BirA family transcriptional regulator, biotin operon repressor / biotin---[acetyl-CoA-carboxylase] ligase